MNNYKFSWVNNGIEFEAPKLTAEIDLEILDYMSKQPEDVKDLQRNIIEFIETIYLVLNKVDRNVTRDMVKQNFSVRELGDLVVAFRLRNNVITCCPYCSKELSYKDIYQTDKKDFQKTQLNTKDIIVTKKEN